MPKPECIFHYFMLKKYLPGKDHPTRENPELLYYAMTKKPLLQIQHSQGYIRQLYIALCL